MQPHHGIHNLFWSFLFMLDLKSASLPHIRGGCFLPRQCFHRITLITSHHVYNIFNIALLAHAYILCIALMPCVDCYSSFRCFPPSIERDPKRRSTMPAGEYLFLTDKWSLYFPKQYSGFLNQASITSYLPIYVFKVFRISYIACGSKYLWSLVSYPILLHHLNILFNST